MNLIKTYEDELLQSIPIVKGMKVHIQSVEPHQVILKAPLNENINYEGTAFGGSLNTMCILSCYLLTHHILKSHNIPFSSLVIQNSQINYLEPVDKDFLAIAQVDPQAAEKFIRSLGKKGLARLQLQSFIRIGDETQQRTQFKARFVAKTH